MQRECCRERDAERGKEGSKQPHFVLIIWQRSLITTQKVNENHAVLEGSVCCVMTFLTLLSSQVRMKLTSSYPLSMLQLSLAGDSAGVSDPIGLAANHIKV